MEHLYCIINKRITREGREISLRRTGKTNGTYKGIYVNNNLEDVSIRNNNDVGIIGDKRGADREDKSIRGMDVNVCDRVISKKGDDADRSIGREG